MTKSNYWKICRACRRLWTSTIARYSRCLSIGLIPGFPEGVLDRLKVAVRHGTPLYLLQQQPVLDMPTMGDVAQALGAELLCGTPASLAREVVHFKVAAMELPNFLGRLVDGSLVITPGDRSDLILGTLLADVSDKHPQIAGVLLTGGLRPAVEVKKLVDGLGWDNLPILLVEEDTFTTAMALNKVESHLDTGQSTQAGGGAGPDRGTADRLLQPDGRECCRAAPGHHAVALRVRDHAARTPSTSAHRTAGRR